MADVKKAAALLVEASRLVDRALLELDAAAAPCTHCGVTVARSHQQWKTYTSLADRPAQFRKFARELERAAGEHPNPAFEPALAAFHAAGTKQTDNQ